MFKLYIISILIWAIILYCAIYALGPTIRKNGWVDGAKPVGNGHVYLYMCAAVPFFRLLLLSGLVAMFTYTKDQWEESQKNKKDDD